ncbi:MAG: ATP-grasp domain-containing protein, partial [Leptospirillia bacterium]
MKIIAQIGYSQAETWAAYVYGDAKLARMEDIPSLPRSGWMPVGTVEFCRAAMAHQSIVEPEPVDYPDALAKWMPYGGHVLRRYGEMP